MNLTGENFIGGARTSSPAQFRGVNPATGATLDPAFAAASPDDAARACDLAEAAFLAFSGAPLETRARLLETIADNIMALGDALLERAHLETGLPLARLTGERGRTVGQLRLFAAEVRDGAWMGLRVDPALPGRTPLPRADLRTRRIAIGPVAVFGASNFPLAFSVAGGDTASALAAGCPVVVKGHPAHPGVCEMIAGAIASAVAALDLPEGVFSMLNGPSHELGGALVSHPAICAVGFTGSRAGGLALCRIAASRPVPIPVYAEMSAVNPVILLPGALAARADSLGRDFVGSLTMGAGQFCTNPGLVLAIEGPALDAFVASAAAAIAASTPATMLSPGIHAAFAAGVADLAATPGVTLAAQGLPEAGPHCARPHLFSVADDLLRANPALAHEVFGASSVVVRCASEAALLEAVAGLEGQLTATLHLEADDHPLAARLLPHLERKAGRILANGWPTGVEVCHAMVHGGPFPATSDARTTSVGTLAIDRFLRPVCYQDLPPALLPDALKPGTLASGGPLRRVDGRWEV